MIKDVPADQPAQNSLEMEFFGEVFDTKNIFSKHIGAIRGHTIKLYLRRQKSKAGCGAVWAIFDIKITVRNQKYFASLIILIVSL